MEWLDGSVLEAASSGGWLHGGVRPSPVLMLEVHSTGAGRRVAGGLDRLGSTLCIQVPPTWLWDTELGGEGRSPGF